VRVLRNEIEDDDGLGGHVLSVAGSIPGLQAEVSQEREQHIAQWSCAIHMIARLHILDPLRDHAIDKAMLVVMRRLQQPAFVLERFRLADASMIEDSDHPSQVHAGNFAVCLDPEPQSSLNLLRLPRTRSVDLLMGFDQLALSKPTD